MGSEESGSSPASGELPPTSAAQTDTQRRANVFRALRHRNYRLYFFGQFTSLGGTWMQRAAQQWLVLSLTNSAMALGIVSFCQFVPMLCVGPFAGVVADRMDRRRLIIITQTLMMLSAFALAALTWTGAVRADYVYLLAAFNGTVRSFDMPGRQSFVIEMVGYEDLANAIALNSLMFSGARMLGPAAAGLIIAWLGTGTCFFLNGLSFLAVIGALLRMDIAPRAFAAQGAAMLKQLREGLAYVWHHRPILYQMLLSAANGFGNQYTVLIPLFARDLLHGGARGYGLLLAAQGLGAMVGAATLASRATTRGIRSNLIAGLFLSAAGVATFGLSPWMVLSLLAQFVVGTGFTSFRASNNTLVQLFVADELRGRVMSTYQLATVGVAPLGALAVGFLGHRLGPSRAVEICAVVTLGCAIMLITRLKAIGRPQAADA